MNLFAKAIDNTHTDLGKYITAFAFGSGWLKNVHNSPDKNQQFDSFCFEISHQSLKQTKLSWIQCFPEHLTDVWNQRAVVLHLWI